MAFKILNLFIFGLAKEEKIFVTGKKTILLLIVAIAAVATYVTYYIVASAPPPLPNDIPENPIRVTKDDLSTKGIRGDLELAFSLSKNSYMAGEIIPVTMSLSNTGTDDITIRSGQTLFEIFQPQMKMPRSFHPKRIWETAVFLPERRSNPDP